MSDRRRDFFVATLNREKKEVEQVKKEDVEKMNQLINKIILFHLQVNILTVFLLLIIVVEMLLNMILLKEKIAWTLVELR